ncbi:GNAT family N-acetyltransferase [Janibacter melonis]|uniref:GNAT family N-acetyltransferase n=1 Tax=Janibacter melonis TaxID=262209 RepID=UPI00204412B4|nr:GNAT family N-acetyltransferase [Janibacter melonis]MCM3556785.1 GNAT family N-acetyltransferase [Janibacter melonis]
MNVRIGPARVEEADALSELALRSKGYWGYDAAFLDACRSELSVSPVECASGDVVVARSHANLLGFYALRGETSTGSLDALFVDPPHMGMGVGAALMAHAKVTAVTRGLRTIDLDADPQAVPFYLRFGATLIGESPSQSIPGRTLPRLRFVIAPEPVE